MPESGGTTDRDDLKLGVADDRARALEEHMQPTLVPGEVEPWGKGARAAMERLNVALASACRVRLEVWNQTARDDPALWHRVERLKSQQRDLLQEFERLRVELKMVVDAARKARGSAEPLERARQLRLRVLDWLGRRAALEEDTRLWLTEAYYRDRGEVGH